MPTPATGTSSGPAAAARVQRFIAAFDLDRAGALTAYSDVLDRDDVRDLLFRYTSMRGLTVADVLPETAGRDLADGGQWIQILDTDNVNRYAASIGFPIDAGSVWYAVTDDTDTTRLPIVLPYPQRRTQLRDDAHTLTLPIRMCRIETPRGPVMLFPREYRRLDNAEALAFATSCSVFTALDLDGTGVPQEWLFYLQARGIPTVDALVLLAHAVRTQRFGYFTPTEPAASDSWGARLEAMSWPLRDALACAGL